MLAICAFLLISISRQSIWIDEGVVSWLASRTTISDLASTMRHFDYSESQMPFYILYMWTWVKIFGFSEIALRASNIPFSILMVSAFAWAARRLLKSRAAWAVLGLSPFLWFYMNEARPYVAVMACASVGILSALAYFNDRNRFRKATWVSVAFFLMACGLHMMVIFVAFAMLAFVWMESRRRQIPLQLIWNDWKNAALTIFPFFLLLGSYFVFTVLRGAGGERGRPGIGNIAFAVYEFLGFGGLGPPRNELRSSHLSVLSAYWPWLTLGLGACVSVLLLAVTVLRFGDFRAQLTSLWKAMAIGVALMVAASSIVGFQFWGRHLAPFFPIFGWTLVFLFSAEASIPHWKQIRTGVLLLVVLAWIASDIRLRFLQKYGKDNYRFASEFTLLQAQRSGGTVVWIANGITARYYGIQSVNDPVPAPWPIRGECVFAANWTRRQIDVFLLATPRPLTIVLSKADIFDQSGAWKAAVANVGATMVASANAFRIYQLDSQASRRTASVDSALK